MLFHLSSDQYTCTDRPLLFASNVGHSIDTQLSVTIEGFGIQASYTDFGVCWNLLLMFIFTNHSPRKPRWRWWGPTWGAPASHYSIQTVLVLSLLLTSHFFSLPPTSRFPEGGEMRQFVAANHNSKCLDHWARLVTNTSSFPVSQCTSWI